MCKHNHKHYWHRRGKFLISSTILLLNFYSQGISTMSLRTCMLCSIICNLFFLHLGGLICWTIVSFPDPFHIFSKGVWGRDYGLLDELSGSCINLKMALLSTAWKQLEIGKLLPAFQLNASVMIDFWFHPEAFSHNIGKGFPIWSW